MQVIILFAGFVGSWLLVAGPIFQAALELSEEDIARDRIQEVQKSVTPPKSVSSWWWIVPPVKVFLEQQRRREYQKRYFTALSREDSKAMITFISKANGWLYVALGGFLLAAKETYELCEHFEWNLAVYIAIIVVLALASVMNTALRMQRSRQMIAGKES